jgi:hypothetical protein
MTVLNSHLPMAEALQVRGCSSIPAYAAVNEVFAFWKKLGGQAPVERHILSMSANSQKVHRVEVAAQPHIART